MLFFRLLRVRRLFAGLDVVLYIPGRLQSLLGFIFVVLLLGPLVDKFAVLVKTLVIASEFAILLITEFPGL